MRISIILILVITLSCGLTGCGQSGPLYMPGHPPPGYYVPPGN